MNGRDKRAYRIQKRDANKTALNLVSLMDIFTILVFFLMVNQSDVEVASNDKIKLPDSVAEKAPKNMVTLLVNSESIVVQGRPIAKVADVLANDAEKISALTKELEYLATRTPMTLEQQEKGRPITIMGDHEIQYKLLKKIMTTCAEAKFNNIFLAVSQLPKKKKEA
jgi:biopolymer transport protein ExbD